MSELHVGQSSPGPLESPPAPSIDDLLIKSISRWAIATSVGIALFDLAILRSYPFPGAIYAVRGLIYGLLSLALLLGTIAITFLGYRIVSMRIVQRPRSVYIIFLPAVLLIGSLLGFVIMTSPK